MHTVSHSELITSRKAPWWWNEIGRTTYAPENTIPSRLIYCNKDPETRKVSAQLMIHKSSLPGMWVIRWKIYRSKKTILKLGGKRITDRWRRFSTNEMMTAFALRGNRVEGDALLAKKVFADYLVVDKFARLGPYLGIIDPETGRPDENISILIQSFMVRQIDQFL
jgi:hypothetical protein